MGVRFLQHVFHRLEEGTVCTEIIVNGLSVSDIGHYAVEDHHLGCLGSRDEHTPLKHVLKQSHCLQTHGFASGIRTGNEQNVFLWGQCYRERHYFFPVAFQ